MQCARKRGGFALYEVLLGVAIFVIGVITLGRAVENCLNASALAEQDNRARQVLANRMAELQASPLPPDAGKESTVDTGFGTVKLIQKARPANLVDADKTAIDGVTLVRLIAQWSSGGVTQSKEVVFYVYRAG